MKLKDRKYPYYFEGEIKPNNSKIVESGVKEIIKASKKYLGKNPEEISVLDVGSGRGDFSIQMAKAFKNVVAVEPYKDAYEYAKKNSPKQLKNIVFKNSTIEKFESKSKFDLIVALTIFEHLKNQKKAFNQMFSLLKEGGIIYITAPNKYWPIEQHYGLPFLAWLPLPLANMYLKMFRGVASYEDSSYSRGYYWTRSFFDKYPCTYEFILPFNTKGAYIGYGKKGFYSVIKDLGIKLISSNPNFWAISKGFIIVIKKNSKK